MASEITCQHGWPELHIAAAIQRALDALLEEADASRLAEVVAVRRSRPAAALASLEAGGGVVGMVVDAHVDAW